ncbi:MAG: dihydroorotase [Clostridia bacterium]|nr:dihydroorotase [Clostridia bacterium]
MEKGLDKNLQSLIEEYKKGNALFLESEEYIIMPSFCDVHVHFREPGFSYKETIYSGSRASARGGYTAVCTMPNLNPVPDSVENLKLQLDIIEKDAVIDVYPYASITKGQRGEELSDMEELKDLVCAFSDDGKGVQTENMIISAMEKAKSLDKMIVAHCEDNSLLFGGYIHKGEYAKAHGHRGICSESEYKQIERDLELAKRIGCKYHVCHISTKESVEVIRKAKKEGVDVTCETGPHYLILTDADLKEDGNFKMNPPLRSEQDKLALIEGLNDGTIDMIATDHAPHSQEEKSKGLEKSAFGIVGIETSFPLLYTYLVEKKLTSLENLIEKMSINPRIRFGFRLDKLDYTIFKKGNYQILSQEFLSKGKNTPFEKTKVGAKCVLTVRRGEIVYKDKEIDNA